MKNTQMKKSRISMLRKGRVKDLGMLEKLGLKIAGFVDGKRCLPREDSSGNWRSPRLDREIRAYDEFASRMFGCLQIEEESAYAHLGELMDSIGHTRRLLADASAELVSEQEKVSDTSRKHGESKLTEAQVAARRAGERAKRMAPIKERVSALQSKLSTEVDEFSGLCSRILEDNNSTRMICNRVKDHLHQRMDVYWNAALRKHPDGTRMPVVPSVEVASRAEDVYMESHKILMKRAEALTHTITGDDKEVA